MQSHVASPGTRSLEIGVFLPLAKNGFVFSANSAEYPPSYRNLLRITKRAEDMGLDYVFSMAKWRGYGGRTQMWDSSFESFSLMTALAAATDRLRLIATVNPLLFHPAMISKMAATTDDVCGGRLGLNLITGSALSEYSQMGVIPDGYEQKRYAYAAEWLHVLKRLWSEPRVTHHGEFFHLEDCISDPKPRQQPNPYLVCAATSDEGLAFATRETDCSFVSGSSTAKVKENSRRAKAFAAKQGTTVTTAVAVNIVLGADDAEAQSFSRLLMEAADVDAMTKAGMLLQDRTRPEVQSGSAGETGNSRIYFGLPVIGGPGEVADQLTNLVIDGDIDSLLLLFPDYDTGLERFEEGVLSLLRKSFAMNA